MCIRDRDSARLEARRGAERVVRRGEREERKEKEGEPEKDPVSYTHLRAHETVLDLVCRLLLEKKKTKITRSGQSARHSR